MHKVYGSKTIEYFNNLDIVNYGSADYKIIMPFGADIMQMPKNNARAFSYDPCANCQHSAHHFVAAISTHCGQWISAYITPNMQTRAARLPR